MARAYAGPGKKFGVYSESTWGLLKVLITQEMTWPHLLSKPITHVSCLGGGCSDGMSCAR